MSDTFFHGIRTNEVQDGPRNLTTPSTAVIGMVVTAEAADADLFPLNTPVLVTNLKTAAADLGADGTARPALEAIAQITTPNIALVRVAEGVDAAATATNIIGSAVDKTGIYALLGAQAAETCKVKPKILGVPGFGIPTVSAAVAAVAKKLKAFGYVGLDTAATIAAAITERETYSDRELMPIYGDFSSGDAVARALAMRALLDEKVGWHASLSNNAVPGVTGAVPPIFFDPSDMSSESGLLNAAGITCIVNSGAGYRFWGNRTCSDDPRFVFETYTRTAQVLQEIIAGGLLWAADKPLHPTLARDILDTINNEFRELKALGRIIGATAWIDSELNTPSTLSQGKLVIDYDYTPVPPLEDLTLNQRFTDRYWHGFAEEVSGAA